MEKVTIDYNRLCLELEKQGKTKRVDLKKYVKGRHVALMWASPDCTSHSKAKGGETP